MEIAADKLLPSDVPDDLAQLMSIWRARDKAQWSQSPSNYRLLAEKILRKGEPLLAFDVVREGLSILPTDVRLRQLQGLALARSGASERANAILEELLGEGQADEETLGMLGRTYKDLAAGAASTAQREQFLKRAAEIYTQAYQTTGGYWTGINAATMSLVCGETDRARELAQKVREQCLKEVEDPSGDSYWELAALGEAALILHDLSQAGEWYTRAGEEGKHRSGDLQSSRRNARLILKYWNEDPDWIGQYLHVPSVIVFAGHMIDRPGRASPRFPGNLESAVAKEVREKIDKLKPGFGFASAACGSDILFLEAMLDADAEVSVVLPYEKEEFVRDSVDFIPNSAWHARYDRVLERATNVITASPQKLEIGGVAYEFCNQLMLGLATIRARQLDTPMIPMAVWDEMSGDGPGGTAAVVGNWRELGYDPEIVDLAKILEGRALSRPKYAGADSAAPSIESNSFASRIVAILFADAVGFSKLSEPEVPRFVQHFLGAIAQLSEKFTNGIIAKNTWGDGLYFVFSDVDLAGKFALQLADLVATTKWEDKGLRAGLSLRIGLHAGPVYEFDDPITGSRSYSGTHVSRAARIEPITPAGQVYASEAFAALAAAQQTDAFTCDYVGQTPMAKDYGTLPTYHVRRT
ncbi:MAG TPA: TRAFs-binding domain-containing protein [Chthoniobacterales bacterium]|jgi:class 3 adenylate cyclase|nr:TRAFs-binding domain-containing protein [Chthoniobacterales bacterium]